MAMRRVREIGELMQPGMCQMEMRREVVAFAPGLGGALDIVENGGSDCRAIGGGQQCEHLLFPAFQAFQLAGALGWHEDRAGAQHKTLRREDHGRASERGAPARRRAVTRLFVQHVSSPSFVDE
jgi:hypothetical protein